MKKFENYASNLRVLARADKEDLNNEFVISGVIDKFSVQFELGWKLLKELLAYEGSKASVTGSPRGIIKEAYAVYPFFDGDIWLDMLKDRNDMAHIYNGNAANDLVKRILEEYIPQFLKLEEELVRMYGDIL
ncbi:MAG: nucleotidyltransferase [Lachnospiraceae bacterium]|jgi:nucleotidyltransferase substrate binding protein (TIGR01987 family)|nr:nucleotidyltransferase [Lachnospiraceae bacterium]MCI9107031.1 nucleotidyltransferase [Lachnospiraceae bacterium]